MKVKVIQTSIYHHTKFQRNQSKKVCMQASAKVFSPYNITKGGYFPLNINWKW